MPRRKYADENVEFPNDYNHRNLLQEPITMHIMKEMDVMPLSPSPFIDENYMEEDSPNQSKPLQMVNGTKRRRVVIIPEKSVYFKNYREDFVFFQKSPQYQPQCEDHFSRLSDEIILEIFKWLPTTSLIKCAEVCKRWKDLSYDESLWTRYDFGKKYVGSGVLGTLLRRGVSILRLAMCEIKSPVFVDVEFACRQRFSKLKYLDLSMATVSSKAVADILAVCNKLKKLSLEACEVNDDCCRFIATNKSLEVLNMSKCVGLTSVGLSEIAKSCVKLKEWNLAWTHLDVTCFEAFLPLLPSTLCRFNISGHRESFTDIALLVVIQRCPNITELDISDCHMLTEVSFMPMVKTLSKLEHLHSSRAYQIPTYCNRYLKQLKNFRNLEIFRTLTDEALSQLRQLMPEIKINTATFSTIARPTTGMKRTSIWGLRVRD